MSFITETNEDTTEMQDNSEFEEEEEEGSTCLSIRRLVYRRRRVSFLKIKHCVSFIRGGEIGCSRRDRLRLPGLRSTVHLYSVSPKCDVSVRCVCVSSLSALPQVLPPSRGERVRVRAGAVREESAAVEPLRREDAAPRGLRLPDGAAALPGLALPPLPACAARRAAALPGARSVSSPLISNSAQRLVNIAPFHQELEKFAIYILRRFSLAAADEPKLFIELLFWKTTKDAVEIDLGYDKYSDSR